MESLVQLLFFSKVQAGRVSLRSIVGKQFFLEAVCFQMVSYCFHLIVTGGRQAFKERVSECGKSSTTPTPATLASKRKDAPQVTNLEAFLFHEVIPFFSKKKIDTFHFGLEDRTHQVCAFCGTISFFTVFEERHKTCKSTSVCFWKQ